MAKAATKPHEYDESKIKTLSSLEHIRTRPGMYIGRLGDGAHPDDGMYVLFKEVVDNAIDEFIMGHGKKIELTVTELGQMTVRDYGRGIPLKKVVDCVSQINTGAKYNSDVFQFSVGLNGVGTKAVNALSASFLVRSIRDGSFVEATFAEGILQKEVSGTCAEENGTLVSFAIDRTVFPVHAKVKLDFIRRRVDYYAYLNAGLTLNLNGQKVVSKRGLLDLLEREVGETTLYDPIYFKSPTLEFTFTHTNGYGENYFSFVNGQHTTDGGTHLSAFREGILKGINDYSKRKFQGVDVRDGVVGAIAIKIQAPFFESQTKNKLTNSEIRPWIIAEVGREVSEYLHKNPPLADRLVDKIASNEKLRKQLAEVKKEAKEKAKRIAIKIPGLRDCKYHLDHKKFGPETSIFLTEGQSALGSLVSCRNPETQALFALKGKPQNVFGMKRDAIYRNAELYNIMAALGIEDSVEGLRYNKIILATDADVDGLHIRNLLLTFFLHFFEELVTRGHVFILETPLFRVRNKKETRYCFTPEDRKKALAEIRQAEITRFKGLGEISPKEFGQFIGKEIRLIPVPLDHLRDVPELLTFFMGNNTPERKQFIMNNLVDDVDDPALSPED